MLRKFKQSITRWIIQWQIKYILWKLIGSFNKYDIFLIKRAITCRLETIQSESFKSIQGYNGLQDDIDKYEALNHRLDKLIGK